MSVTEFFSVSSDEVAEAKRSPDPTGPSALCGAKEAHPFYLGIIADVVVPVLLIRLPFLVLLLFLLLLPFAMLVLMIVGRWRWRQYRVRRNRQKSVCGVPATRGDAIWRLGHARI